MGHRKMAAYGEREHNGRYALEDYEYSRNHTKAETMENIMRIPKNVENQQGNPEKQKRDLDQQLGLMITLQKEFMI